MKPLTTRQEYDAVMQRAEELVQKATAVGGFENLTEQELDEYGELGAAAEKYEDEVLKIYPFTGKTANTVVVKLEEEMFRRRMKQREMADFLGISNSRFSDILRGKSRINIRLAKAMHTKLGIDGNLILENA